MIARTRASRFGRGFDRRVTAAVVAGATLVGVAAFGAAASSASVSARLRKAPLPESLTEVESSAEDIVDYALSGDRARVVTEAADLKATASGAAASALFRSGVPPAEVAQLEQRTRRLAKVARSRSFIGIALAANAVSQLMPELYARFRDPVPATILELDFLDREAELRSLARQPKKVVWAAGELERTWPRVRARVVAAGGAEEATAYDRHVAALNRLQPAAGKKIRAEAVRGLELVDDLERVFVR